MRASVRTGIATLLAVVASAVGCSDRSPTAPMRTTDAEATAARFDHMADSMAAAGDDENASAARGMAELVRAVGRVNEVVLSVDGRAVTHTAIAMELLTPESACDTSPDPELCRMYNPPFMQFVIGWSDLDFREGFSLATERSGTTSVSWEDSPDFYAFADVEYFKRDPRGEPDGMFGAPARIWFSEQGTVTTAAGVRGAVCQTSGQIQPGASVSCHQASFTPSFDVTAYELTFDAIAPQTPLPLSMAAQRVDGLSIDVNDVGDTGDWDYRAYSAARATRQRAATAKMRGLLWRAAPAFAGARATRRTR